MSRTFADLTSIVPKTIGDILYAATSGVWTRLAAGTAGQVLRSNGAAAPVWGDATGAWTLISTTTPTAGATASLTGLDPTKYRDYMIVMEALVPAVDGDILYMRTSSDGGSTYDSGAGNYAWSGIACIASAASAAASNADTEMQLTNTTGIGNNSGPPIENVSGIITIENPGAAQNCCVKWSLDWWRTDATYCNIAGAGRRLANADVDAVRIQGSTSGFNSGTVKLYGLRI